MLSHDVLPGPLLFSRYAFMPNHLGYCGGSDSLALLEYGVRGQVDGGLIDLERQFEGAYPYLQLIARTNDVADPLDAGVVEAYWIGNPFTDRVNLGAFYTSIQERFRSRANSREWKWLDSKAPAGAKPHHSFHVLEIYPRVGLMRAGVVDQVIETMHHCLIRWGRVVSVSGAQLVVEAPALRQEGGKLRLSAPRPEVATRQHDGKGFVDAAREGDWVALHWGWACDVLTPDQQAYLERYTRWHLELCNQTI